MRRGVGIGFIPGSFPTGEVIESIENLLGLEYARDKGWTRAKVNDIYLGYVAGVAAGQGIYDTGNVKIVPWVANYTKYGEGDVRLFLFNLKDIATKGLIDLKWWRDPSPGKVIETASSVFKAPGTALESIPKIASAVRTVGILALVVVGLFYANKIFRTIKKRG